MNSCPCRALESNGLAYSKCCEPVHKDQKLAKTAEALMRARYSAYALGKIDFIAATNDPNAKEPFDRTSAETWSKESEWQGLEIRATEAGTAKDEIGHVEFVARFKTKGQEYAHHEVGHFLRNAAGWLFMDGDLVQTPLVRKDPKVGRNDPCPCGSGKKYKKCCAIAD